MGFLSKIFGKKPKVPEFTPVDYDKEYDATWDYNEKNIERFGGIARKAQEQDQEAILQSLRSSIKGYDDLISSEFDITMSMMRGELTKREQDRIRDRRAALGLSTGTQDSDLTQYSYNRDLGLAERDAVNQGMAYADNIIRRQAQFAARAISVGDMFQSPQQRIAQKMSERDSKFNRDFAANKVAAAPSPVAVGLSKVAMAAVGGMAGAAAGAGTAMGSFGGGMMGAQMGAGLIGGGGGGGGNMMSNLAMMAMMRGGGSSQVPLTTIPSSDATGLSQSYFMQGKYSLNNPDPFAGYGYKPTF